MYEVITLELRWESDYRRAWFINCSKEYNSIQDIAKDYGSRSYDLRILYHATYKNQENIKDPATGYVPKTYFCKPTIDFPMYRRFSGWSVGLQHDYKYPSRRIVIYKNDINVSMVTIYMAAMEVYKNLKRDSLGRIISHRHYWRSRHSSAAQMRWPTTKNELVKNDALNCDRDDLEEIGYSGHLLKARKRWLPTAWDDLHTDKGNTWKTHRKKQYRIKS